MKQKRQELQHIPDEFQENIDLTLRVPDTSDAKSILGLLRHVTKETDYLTISHESPELTCEQQKRIIEVFEEVETNLMIVAEVDDQIVGLANLATFGGEKEDHVADTGVCLIKEYWGLGIGTALMEEIIHFARKVDLKILTLEVVTENTPAIRLYEKMGFEIVGTLHNRLRNGYHYYDVHVMELIL